MKEDSQQFDIKISLNNVRNVKTLYIDEIGSFTVRKLGAGEELDLSDRMRRLGVILNELGKINFKDYDATKSEDILKLEEISKRADKLTKEVSEIQRFELATYKACFSDEVGGTNVDKLLDSLSTEDRVKLFRQIFDPIKIVEAPEADKEVAVEQEKPVDNSVDHAESEEKAEPKAPVKAKNE